VNPVFKLFGDRLIHRELDVGVLFSDLCILLGFMSLAVFLFGGASICGCPMRDLLRLVHGELGRSLISDLIGNE
jgi:hypothetical protein